MEELRWIYRTAPGMMESKIKFQFSQSNLFLIDEFNWADLCCRVCRLYLRTFNGWITVPAIDGTRWPFGRVGVSRLHRAIICRCGVNVEKKLLNNKTAAHKKLRVHKVTEKSFENNSF